MPPRRGLTDPVAIPTGLNPGLSSARQTTMLSLLGNPRSTYSQECQALENKTLAKLVVFEDVGPFQVRGLKPAVDSLREVMRDVATTEPAVHAVLGTVGMLCARFVRDSTTSISNHSWGTAIDLTIAGVLDKRGDNKVQHGLTLIAPAFNRQGWFWGAAFRTEDAMHFEAGEALIRRWHTEGRFAATTPAPAPALTIGDRGPAVTALQKKLKAAGAAIEVDGDFGPATRAAVIAFQAARGLTPDGVVAGRTLTALGL